MSDKPSMDNDRRKWLIATSAVGGVGAAAALYPFVDSFEPSERAKAAGAAVEIDITGMKPDEMRTVEWRGKPVWVIRRTPEQVAELSKIDGELADPDSLRNPSQFTPPYAQNQWRSIKPEYLYPLGLLSECEV
jgi:ubiquinol-cytochrome c reductase iron-sulfur subunit